MGRHEGEAMGRQKDLVLDASLPKHKNFFIRAYGGHNLVVLRNFGAATHILRVKTKKDILQI